MAQLRGQGSYGLGAGPVPAFGSPQEDNPDSSPLAAIREQTSKIEDLLDTVSEPIKPCVFPVPTMQHVLAIQEMHC